MRGLVAVRAKRGESARCGRQLSQLVALALAIILPLLAPPASAAELAYVERVAAAFTSASRQATQDAAWQGFSTSVRRYYDLEHIGGALLPGRWQGLPESHRAQVRGILATFIAQEVMREWRPGVEASSEILGVRNVLSRPGVGVRVRTPGREQVVILVLTGSAGRYRVGDVWVGGASLVAEMQSRIEHVRPLDLSTPDRIVATLSCRLLRIGC